MKKLFFIMLSVLSIFGYSQTSETKIDDMTGDTIVKTEKIEIYHNAFKRLANVQFIRINSQYFLVLEIRIAAKCDVKPESDLILKFDSGTVVLKSQKYAFQKRGVTKIIYFIPDDITLSYLYGSELKKVRVYCDDGYDEFEVPEKFRKKFQKGVLLIKK